MFLRKIFVLESPKWLCLFFFKCEFPNPIIFIETNHIKTKLVDKELNTTEICTAPGPIV